MIDLWWLNLETQALDKKFKPQSFTHTHIPETYNEIGDDLSVISKLLKDQSISNHKYERKHGVALRSRRERETK